MAEVINSGLLTTVRDSLGLTCGVSFCGRALELRLWIGFAFWGHDLRYCTVGTVLRSISGLHRVRHRDVRRPRCMRQSENRLPALASTHYLLCQVTTYDQLRICWFVLVTSYPSRTNPNINSIAYILQLCVHVICRVQVTTYDRLRTGWFSVLVTSYPDRIHEALAASLAVLRELALSPVTPRELMRAKRTLMTRWVPLNGLSVYDMMNRERSSRAGMGGTLL